MLPIIKNKKNNKKNRKDYVMLVFVNTATIADFQVKLIKLTANTS